MAENRGKGLLGAQLKNKADEKLAEYINKVESERSWLEENRSSYPDDPYNPLVAELLDRLKSRVDDLRQLTGVIGARHAAEVDSLLEEVTACREKSFTLNNLSESDRKKEIVNVMKSIDAPDVDWDRLPKTRNRGMFAGPAAVQEDKPALPGNESFSPRKPGGN